MREIKFRLWDKRSKELMPTDKNLQFYDKENYWIADIEDALINKERFELMQYTGLKDKNGTEIFEGDIIKGWSNCTYTVTFVEKRGGYYPFAQGDGCGCCDDEVESDPSECTVIGNCYENPELLEEV